VRSHEFAKPIRQLVLPNFHPCDRRNEYFVDFLGTQPARIGLECEAVWIGIRIEAGHDGLLDVFNVRLAN
jgi:hypothetical protein